MVNVEFDLQEVADRRSPETHEDCECNQRQVGPQASVGNLTRARLARFTFDWNILGVVRVNRACALVEISSRKVVRGEGPIDLFMIGLRHPLNSYELLEYTYMDNWIQYFLLQ